MIAVPAYLGRTLPEVEKRRGTRAAAHDRRGPEFTLIVGCGGRTPTLLEGLEREGMRGVGVLTGSDAVVQCRSLRPDLIVVGTDLGRDNPLTLVRELSGESPDATVLFLADRSDRGSATRALAAGADDVAPPPHSIAAILLRALVATKVAHRNGSRGRRRWVAGLEIEVEGRRVWDGARPVNLSAREFQLLMRLVDAAGDVVSREALLRDIWGAEHGSDAVLDATVHRLRRKIEKNHGSPRVLTTVRGVGYRLEAVDARR